MSLLKYLNPIYWIYGEEKNTIICVNSYSPTNKLFNYVVSKQDHDDCDERFVRNTLLDAEEYLENINK